MSTATVANTITTGAGEYTPERLSELRRNALSFSSASKSETPSAGGMFKQ